MPSLHGNKMKIKSHLKVAQLKKGDRVFKNSKDLLVTEMYKNIPLGEANLGINKPNVNKYFTNHNIEAKFLENQEFEKLVDFLKKTTKNMKEYISLKQI